MSFKPGDKVKFLNDVGGGIVKRIVKQTAYIETPDGFEIPALFNELVKIDQPFFADEEEPEYKVTSPKNKTVNFKRPAEPEPEPEPIADEYDLEDTSESFSDEEIINSENSTLNIILGILPIKEKGKNDPLFHIYLISDCAYRMLFTFSVIKENFCYGNKSGMVEEDTKLLVNTFSMNDLRELQSFKFNCIFYKKGIFLPHEPLVYEYKIDLFRISDPKNWEENDYFDEKAIIVNLTEESLIYEIERMVTENEERYVIQKKRKDQQLRKPVKPVAQETEEVDLHIEQLTDNFSQLSPGEIIDMQLGRFTFSLESAIRSNTKRIVFIHGVGNGKLKYELRKILDSKYPQLKYQDASFKEYGYGATMVLLKK